eukprot:2166877-Rhodomonas_salina.2
MSARRQPCGSGCSTVSVSLVSSVTFSPVCVDVSACRECEGESGRASGRLGTHSSTGENGSDMS